MARQEYTKKPVTKRDVQGLSSKSIFKFMTIPDIDLKKVMYYPLDVDDFERNRSLLLWYPEWRERLLEMCVISQQWRNLVENWTMIEQLYDADYAQYNNKAYRIGKCCQYIRSLVKH